MNDKLDTMIRRAYRAEGLQSTLSPGRQERIWSMTKEKIEIATGTRNARRPIRPIALLVAALVVLALLSATVFASAQLGLLDLGSLFGDRFGLISEDVVTYPTDAGRTVPAVIGTPGPLEMHHEEPEDADEPPEGWGQRAAQISEYNETVPERQESDYRFAAAAETQDYRFSLRSLVAGPSAIYGVLDMEPLTDFGCAHMEDLPELVCSNRTARNGGATDCVLLERTGDINRILVYCMCSDWAENRVGDAVGFEILSFYEAGDPNEHNAFLFDARLERIVTARAFADAPDGVSEGTITWDSLCLTPMDLEVTGSGADYTTPRVSVTLRDGSEAELVGPDGGQTAFGDYGAVCLGSGSYWSEPEGTVHLRVLFSRLLDPAQVAMITVDGQRFRITDVQD